MPKPLRLLVTDVTCMRNRMVCVAGWCAARSRMVRPLRAEGRHWSEALATPEMWWPGKIVGVVPADVPSGRGPPHGREDTILRGAPLWQQGYVPIEELAARLTASESPSLAALFRYRMVASRWVPGGAPCPSLGAVRVRADRFLLCERAGAEQRQLRCTFHDLSGAEYSLPVVAKLAVDEWRANGLLSTQQALAGARHLHVRIGLAHPSSRPEWPEPRAYAMVNGIFCY